MSSPREEPEAIPEASRLLEVYYDGDAENVQIRPGNGSRNQKQKETHDSQTIFSSPLFVFTFILAIAARCLIIADVGTDIAQAVVFWLRREPTQCVTLSTSSTNTSTTPTYLPLNASWFAVTFLAIYLPALMRVLRLPARKILYHYLYHPLSARSLNCDDANCDDAKAVEDCAASGCSNFLSFVILFDLFFILPFLLVIKQFKLLILMMQIERREKFSTDESLNSSRKSKRDNAKSMKKEHAIDDRKTVEEILHEALKSQKKPICSKRSSLINQLVQLSDDRQEEAMLEAAPQLILNLMIIIRYGGSMLRYLSALFSLSSLIISTASYSINKLKKNPVKREMNIAGIILISLTKFPCILSRCASIAILLSLQNMVATSVGGGFIALLMLLGGLFEYMHMEKLYREINLQHILQILMRGWISVFVLPEYRLKRCVEGFHWLDESDYESARGELKEPKSRLLIQLIYLIAHTVINIAFGVWCYYFLNQHSHTICLFSSNPYVRHAAFSIVMIGAPVSLLITLLVMNRNVRWRITCDTSFKAREAFSWYIEDQVRRGRGIDHVISLLKRLPDNERQLIINFSNDPEMDVLANILRNQIKHHGNLDEFLQFRSLGYQLNKKSEDLLVTYAETVLAVGDVPNIVQLLDVLKTLPENQLGLVIESDSRAEKGIMFNLVQHALHYPTNMLHMYGEFKELGFYLKEYTTSELQNQENGPVIDALIRLLQSTPVKEDENVEEKGSNELLQLLSSNDPFRIEFFSLLQQPFEEGILQGCKLCVRFNMEEGNISTIHNGLDNLKELLSTEFQKVVNLEELEMNDSLCYILRYIAEKNCYLDTFLVVENIGRPLHCVNLLVQFSVGHNDGDSDDAGVMFTDVELVKVLFMPDAQLDTYV